MLSAVMRLRVTSAQLYRRVGSHAIVIYTDCAVPNTALIARTQLVFFIILPGIELNNTEPNFERTTQCERCSFVILYYQRIQCNSDVLLSII